MKFEKTSLPDVLLVDIEPIRDTRGFFARSWCQREFADLGLNAEISQVNISQSHYAGTLRGLHYQTAPFEEAKLVRCNRGRIFDVAVDMRESSPSFLQWTGHELSVDNHRGLFIPKGFAHGYQTLVNDSEILYLNSEFYAPGAEAGFRYDDPKIGIEWPHEVKFISDKDKAWPLL